jgi:hypothetical protein
VVTVLSVRQATVLIVATVNVVPRCRWPKAVLAAVPRWVPVTASLREACWAPCSARGVCLLAKLKDTRVAGKQLKLRRYRED